ncbi:transcriptional regulatory protein GAL4 [Blastomyces dermatitidis ER-3]|uniref:Transcriptional regulatory protein GAL4 n=1 Tax=Ajellomyces dermatitidis (strain ER-3 / ATCC MYA-2586) TaxID=559297 RepID=A0ABP2EQ98_AJEDR|nr:transcriptional regulatory protein GAL4 [Blastomyces dermatitidis ER-3]EEQ85517.2 transcriptional regulatory protein GAL4 [Blastomyces dermatitidis ER-3]
MDEGLPTMTTDGQTDSQNLAQNQGQGQGQSSGSGQGLQSIACDECRLRKSKCSKERPTCSLCKQLKKECVYSPKVVRTPLTRQNLTNAEERIRKLEAVISTLLPNVDIEEFLGSSSPQPSDDQCPLESEPPQKPVSVVIPKDAAAAPEAASEALPQLADGFDWAEKELTLSELSDGMAALSIRPEGAGYLGGPSSVAPLRALFMGGWDVNSPSQSAAAGKAAPESQSMMWQSTHPGIAPSQVVAQTVIDAYFANYHTSYPFLHEETFRAQFNEQIPRPRGHAWPILLNTVLALGAWTLGDDNVDIHETFYNEANRYLQDVSVFEVGNLACVQAFLLLSNYTQKRNKLNTGWNYLGLAIRMALSLGLHKEFPQWNISLLQREMRRRVWWGTFIFDSGASITFGRPILLPDACIMDAKQVKNIPETALTATTTSDPVECDQPTLYSSLIAQAKFHLTTNELYHYLLSNRNLSAEETLKLQIPIDDFLCSLPPFFERDDSHYDDYSRSNGSSNLQLPCWFEFAKKRLSWRRWNFQIILYRPILLTWATQRWKQMRQPQFSSSTDPNQAPPADEECRMRCLRAARATIESISCYMVLNPYTRIAGWYMLYFLFQAALIPVLFLITTPTSPSAPSWLSDIHTIRCLLSPHSSLGKNNRLAARCLEVINRLCGPVAFPSPSSPRLPAGSASGTTFDSTSDDNPHQYIDTGNTTPLPPVATSFAKTAAGPSGNNNNVVRRDDENNDDGGMHHAWEADMAGIISQEMSVQNQEMMFGDAYSFFTGAAGSHENFGNLSVVPGGVRVGGGGGGGGAAAAAGGPPAELDHIGGTTSGNNISIESTAAAEEGVGPPVAPAGMEFFDWTGFGTEGAVEGKRYF